MNSLRRLLVTSLLICMVLTLAPPSAQAQTEAPPDPLTPVVVFPAFHFTMLEVKVQDQTTFPECPMSGKFEDWFLNPNPNPAFSQVCRDKLLTLIVDPDAAKPMPERFSNQLGVDVKVKHYGNTESAPFYEPMYAYLEANGYKRNQNIRVAGYDSRLTPDIGDFMQKTVALIEETYYANHQTPVHLVGHSNGPLYAQYLLTHMPKAWKDQFIHGFTPIAGNWPGQGLLYTVYFTGLNIIDFDFPQTTENAISSAAMYASHPSSYMSSADPDVFAAQEVVMRDAQNGVAYTPLDYPQLFQDAGITLAQELADYYIGFIEFQGPAYPNVDVYAEKGSGLETLVGVELPDLTVGQIFGPTDLYTRDGDHNQEDITNDAIEDWSNMSCYRFELTDTAGGDHFALPGDGDVLKRLIYNLSRPKSICP